MRLHPSAIIVWWRDLTQQLGLYGLIPVVGQLRDGGIERAALIVALVLALFLAGAVAQWARFSYEVRPDALVVRGGLFSRYERVIPTPRIQSIDTVQKLSHRIFGAMEVRVETVGGGATEGRLRAVTPVEAERVRATLLPTDAPPEVREAPPLVTLTAGRTLLAGLTGGRVAALAIVGGIVSDLTPDDAFGYDDLVARGIEPVAAALILVSAVMFVSLVVSLISTVFVFWRFTVRREEDRLVITRGLLDRRRAVVPLRRIQAFQIHENIIRRPFGLASVSVKVAGYAGDQQQVQASSVLLPLGTRARAFDLVSGLLPEPMAAGRVPLEPAPRRALRRRIMRGVFAGIVVGVALLASDARTLAGFAAVLVTVPLAWPAYRSLGHAIDGRYAIVRSGLFVRTTSVVPVANTQVLHLSATPTQRAARLVNLRLRVPKATVTAYDLDRGRAYERFGALESQMVTG